MIDKFEKKLSSWKKQYLSMGGRITLINCCLSNLLVYYVSFQEAKVSGGQIGPHSQEFFVGEEW